MRCAGPQPDLYEMLPPMSDKEFRPAKALLPSLLAKLTRESGRASHLMPLWEDVVGAVAAKHTHPLALEGTSLHVQVRSPRWKSALEVEAGSIIARLNERLGEGAVAQLVFHSVEPK